MARVFVHLTYLVVVAMYKVAFVSGMTYYATPNPSINCLEEGAPCFTLSQYATKPSNFFASNTTLILLPGNHSLDLVFWITNITSLSITATNTTSTPVTIITCSETGRFQLEDVEQVSMSDLIICGCVNNSILSVGHFKLECCTLNGQGRDGTGLDIQFTTDINITSSLFLSNSGTSVSHPFRSFVKGGGAVVFTGSNGSISSSHFHGNTADFGGAIFCLESFVKIENSTFANNIAGINGGGVFATAGHVAINGSVFFKNSLTESESFGGAVGIFNSSSSIDNCFFHNNSAGIGGGAVDLFNSYRTNYMSNNEFVNNSAAVGSAIVVEGTSLESTGYLNIHDNQHGTIHAFACRLILSGTTTITNNTYTNSSLLQQVGGAINSFQSEISFENMVTLSYNKARKGGAILATESRLNFQGNVSISFNSANESGGGIYAYLSELNFWGRTDITGNVAADQGGGIHSVDSTTSLREGSLHFVANSAIKGGGVCLELNAKLYVIKNVSECAVGRNCVVRDPDQWHMLEFAYNSADYGGALFISDDTLSSTCNSIPFRAHALIGECFFQTLALHPWVENELNLRNAYFINNTARKSGNTLHGGLLDRCTVSSFAEIFRIEQYTHLNPSKLDAISYFLNLTNIKREDLQSELSSDPVRVCFCKNNQPDCSYEPPTVFLRKGETFSVSLVAVDQVNSTIPYTNIHNSVSNEVGLGNGVSNKITHKSCTVLDYNIFSSRSKDQLFLHPSGPCKDGGISKTTIQVTFKSCPIGFLDSRKDCDCDPLLYPKFVTNCSIDDESVIRRDSVWISLLNESDENGYMIYENCPFDYCHQPTKNVLINLNLQNGSDAQCAFNRSGKLCGACKDGLSLSLGSSRCKSCSNNWLALLIVFAIAGVALVAFILLCNLTVAVGTINGLVFYANIIAANSAIFFPIGKQNILTIFISWLNLDFGFETCFYTGLDGYSKTWLQFVFPAYILVLVLCIVVACHYLPRFAHLLLNRNPVATLATLILLSYAKLLRTVIAALSFATLQRHTSDGKVETSIIWLIDANISYFQGKHIPLFFTALFVLVIGLAYTFLLLLWQWFQHSPNRRCLRWIRNAKLNAFMEAYHGPYTKRQRYWTGLLLLVRAVLYLVAALNVVRDSRSTLLSIACIVGGLSFLRNVLQYKVYRRWPLNALESSFIFNLVIFATATLYVRETGGNQAALAYTSISIAFLTFLCILVYHAFTNFKSLQKLKNSVMGKWNKKKRVLTEHDLQNRNECFENEQSKEFTSLREPLDIFDHDPVADDYFIVEQSSYKPPKLVNQAVTQTVVDVIPDLMSENIN